MRLNQCANNYQLLLLITTIAYHNSLGVRQRASEESKTLITRAINEITANTASINFSDPVYID